MPETAGRGSKVVSPELIVSDLDDDQIEESLSDQQKQLVVATKPHSPQRDSFGLSLTSPEWIDVDKDAPSRRKRRSSKRTSQRHHKNNSSQKYPAAESALRLRNEQDRGLSFARLSRILGTNEPAADSRSSTPRSDQRRHRERSSTRRTRRVRADDSNYSLYHRPVKHPHHSRLGTTTLPRRPDSRSTRLSRLSNPSLLSILSSLTGRSDWSSGSNTTITQGSFDRGPYSISNNMSRPRGFKRDSINDKRSRVDSPDVFKFMVQPSTENDRRDSGIAPSSPTSSQYSASDAGSSEAPDTPSSRSTYPSPTMNRSDSAAEVRHKYDSQQSASSTRCDSHSPDPSLRNRSKQATVTDIEENDEDEDDDEDDDDENEDANTIANDDYDEEAEESRESIAPLESDLHRQRSSSRPSRPLHRPDNMPLQHDARLQHMAYADNSQHSHLMEPSHSQRRSASTSSAGSDRSAYAYHAPMQQYQYPVPPGVPYPPPMTGPMVHPEYPPPAPDSPDLTTRTLAGYEMMALELTNRDSNVPTMYRKFEYLNHRVLLHLQDELSELEEQLRTIDELIAQMDPAVAAEGRSSPVSRRAETYHGAEIHLRRTQLLGRVFLKTDQYNRAMANYASMSRDFHPAHPDQIACYRDWMDTHAPVHETEARFLHRSSDLVVPGASSAASASSSIPMQSATLVYLPVALMLPLLLFSVIPSLTGRLMVTALIATGAFVAASSTRLWQLLQPREWAVCGAAYVLVMSTLAGCIPRHSA